MTGRGDAGEAREVIGVLQGSWRPLATSHPTRRPVNHALTTGDQNLTEVDARLTKVDKTCHRQPRTNLNKSEQIRTPPNPPTR